VTDEVRAAGGVVVRDGQVLVVHRPRHDDWSLPKGKLDPGERWEDAALREVLEETGLRCELGPELDPAEYQISGGRPKRVRFWRMDVIDGEFAANEEVDEARWCSREQALGLLTYVHDRELVASVI
jgi:8-oxo-dGTP diphosphatase